MSGEELAQQAADRVREVIAAAERRASEIVQGAESEASQIRERAEADARQKLERARRALSELAGETPAPSPAPDPAPPAPAPDPGPPPAAPEPPAPKPAPLPESLPRPPTANSHGGEDSTARLVAMRMALDGKGRGEIEAELNQRLGDSDRGSMLDDVLARAAR